MPKKKKATKKENPQVKTKPKKDFKNLNLFQKLQKVRVILDKEEVKKTGYNETSDFWYFQLSDFLPRVNELNEEYGLYAKCNFTRELATLTIWNTDKMEEKEVFETPMSGAAIEGADKVQNLGASVTYLRRYMYMTAYEISDQCEVDGNKKKKPEKGAKEELTPVHVSWGPAVEQCKEKGSLDFILKHFEISDENKVKIKKEAKIA